MFASRSKAAAVDPAHELPRPAEPAPSPSPLGTQTLQRSLGNGYLQAGWTGAGKGEEPCCPACSLGCTSHPVQPKLTIGSPGDPYEQEADQVSQRVMRMAEPGVQRKRVTREAIQTKQVAGKGDAVSPGVESRIRSLRGGEPLPQAARAFFEPRFGYDFSAVRVHTGATADDLNRTLSAHAFATGQNIVFRQGEYTPDSHAGKELLAHELTHVIQQGVAVQSSVARCSAALEPDDSDAIRSARDDAGSKIESAVPSVQADLAIEPPNPTADAAPLTDAQVQEAIRYNTLKMRAADAALIGTLRTVLGIPADPPSIDEDFVNAVARWQASNNLTQDGKLGPGTAAPLFKELKAEGLGAESTALANIIRRGKVKKGPTYTPNGVQAAAVAGGLKQLPFTMAAEFEHDPENGIFASCCEVRQQIQWNAAAAASFMALTGHPILHGGFPAGHPADTLIEDTNLAGTLRYGHRTGFTGGVVGNRFLNAAGNLDQANGVRFEGRDFPGGPAALAGQWRFRLSVVDVCNEFKELGADNLTINW